MTQNSAVFYFDLDTPDRLGDAHRQPVTQLVVEASPFEVTEETYTLEIVLDGVMLLSDERGLMRIDGYGLLLAKSAKLNGQATADYKALRICFDACYLQYCIMPLLPRVAPGALNEAAIFTCTRPVSIESDIALMLRQLSSVRSNTALIIRELSRQILLKVCMEHAASLGDFLTGSPLTAKADVSYFLEANFTRKLAVGQLAAAAGRSESALKRDFAAVYTIAPVQWLINRRLDHAFFLIRYTDYSVASIAVLCGFGTVSHFAKSYKKRFGLSPLQSKLKGIP